MGIKQAYFIPFVSLLFSILIVNVGAAPRQKQSINIGWKFNYGDVTGAQNPAFSDNGWKTINLPHTFQYVDYKHTSYARGIGWYRKKMAIPSAVQGNKVFLRFEGVMQLANVYINGTLIQPNPSAVPLATHDGGFTPFQLDVTTLVKFGTDSNVIAVQVDNRQENPGYVPPEAPTPLTYMDYNLYGGIYRNVYLIVTDDLYVQDELRAKGGTFVTTPVVSSSSATVRVRTAIKNEYTIAKTCLLKTTILDKNGTSVTAMQSTQSIAPNDSFLFDQTSNPISSPLLWSPVNPYLYTARTEVYDNMTLVDTLSTTFGIRSIQFLRATGFFLNGNRVKLLGLNRHQTFPFIANALPDRAQYRDAKVLKDISCNFIRLSHYPQSQSFLDACDQLGIMVWEEVPTWSFSGTLSMTWQNHHYDNVRDMVRRDRNHPSVIVWGVGINEYGITSLETGAHAIAKAEDSTRFTTCARNYTTTNNPLDIYGHNCFTPPLPSAQVDPGSVGYINSEHTGHTYITHRTDAEAKIIEHARRHEAMAVEQRNRAWCAGGTGWCAFDYNSTAAPSEGMQWHGVADLFRIPKFAYYFYQSQSAGDNYDGSKHPMVFIESQANYAMPSTQTFKVYSNCDQVELFVNGVPQGTKSPDAGSVLAHPPFTFSSINFSSPGTLRADGKIGGTVRATHTVMHPATASKILLWSDTDTLIADGTDVARIVVSIVDNNGTVLPQAANMVSVSVTGAGKVICGSAGPVANGSIAVEGGQLAFLVQAGLTGGTVQATATSSGLTQAQVSLVVLESQVEVRGWQATPHAPVESGEPSIRLKKDNLFIAGLDNAFFSNIKILTLNGKIVSEVFGKGGVVVRNPLLHSGAYMIQVTCGARNFRKNIMLVR